MLGLVISVKWLVQHGGPPGCDFVRNGWSMSPTLMDHRAYPGLGLLSCERLADQAPAAAPGLLLNVHKQPT
jgi:hypothetical protein